MVEKKERKKKGGTVAWVMLGDWRKWGVGQVLVVAAKLSDSTITPDEEGYSALKT